MDDRRLLVAALLSLAVLILWQVVFPPPEPPRPVAPPAAVEREAAEREPTSPDAPAQPGETSDESARAGTEEAVVDAAGDESAVGAPAAPIEVLEADREESIVVERNGTVATFSNRGAQLVSLELLGHLDTEGGRVDLVRRRAGGTYWFALSGPNDRLSPFNDRLFVHERSTDERGRERVDFRFSGPDGQVRKSFVFRSDGLVEVEIAVPGDERWGLVLGPGVRNPDEREQADRFARRSGVFLAGGDVETIDSQSAEEAAVLPGRGLDWVGLQDSYFLAAVLPQTPIDSAVFLPNVVRPAEGYNVFERVEGELADGDDDLTRELELIIYPGAESFQAVAYLGSKKYERLAELGNQLEDTVSLGFFSFLARPLLWALLWIHDHVVANYGWAIVLLTLLVRIVLFPLTHKSTVSMRKMQGLNPQVQAIRQKYRAKLKDKKGRPNAEAQRKMNEEIMGLYKKEGVNPAGGCLPILLQMPVLFAFYSLLSAAVELRGAPWMLWIQDLSAPDPFYVLPIVMGASQYVQQKLMPAGGDPMQRRIMMLMPAFFTILFLKFASGLVLYWLTSNVLTIFQTAITNRLLENDNDSKPSKSRKQEKKR